MVPSALGFGRELAKSLLAQVLSEAISEIVSIAADKLRERLHIRKEDHDDEMLAPPKEPHAPSCWEKA